MFRELTRKNKQITESECVQILTEQTRGVLSVNGDMGYPYGMPMNHYYDETDGCVYFHCGKGGHRLDSIKRCDKVSFCVYEEGYRNEGEWALNVRSVIVFGRIEVVCDMDTIVRIAAGLCHKFTGDEDYIRKEIENHAASTLLLKLIPEHICGKAVREE